jgi:hypothetical protein
VIALVAMAASVAGCDAFFSAARDAFKGPLISPGPQQDTQPLGTQAPGATPRGSLALSVMESLGPSPIPSATTTGAAPSTPAIERFFYIGSDGGLAPGPAKPARFTIDKSWRLVTMTTYHYVNRTGVPAPGQIGLIGPGGAVYGPWQTTGSDGQGDIPNAYWTATVDVVLPPGTYEVTDSDHATWSHNEATRNSGMAWGSGYPATDEG